MSITCQIFLLPTKNQSLTAARIKITSAETGNTRIVIINETLTLEFNMGDQIKCSLGAVFVWVKPRTGATGFCLIEKSKLLSKSSSKKKWQTELILDEETTKIITRGDVHVAESLGSDSKGSVIFR